MYRGIAASMRISLQDARDAWGRTHSLAIKSGEGSMNRGVLKEEEVFLQKKIN